MPSLNCNSRHEIKKYFKKLFCMLFWCLKFCQNLGISLSEHCELGPWSSKQSWNWSWPFLFILSKGKIRSKDKTYYNCTSKCKFFDKLYNWVFHFLGWCSVQAAGICWCYWGHKAVWVWNSASRFCLWPSLLLWGWSHPRSMHS